MTKAQRTFYFKQLWPDACAANGWSVRDDNRRKTVTADCMSAIGGPDTDSTSGLGEDEVTALFCYLDHLAAPADLDKSARWVTCQEDYRTFNRAKQADWHERELYGKRPNKLDRDRFAGETSAAAGPLDNLDAEAVRQRHLTMASRHQKKQRREGVTQPSPRKAAPEAIPAPQRGVSVPVGVTVAEDDGNPF